ncbi:MAG: hypothetical protein AB7I79_01870 [Rhizobiaceae bacterium]
MFDYAQYNSAAPSNPEAETAPHLAARPGSLATIIERVEKAIEEETSAIRADPRFDIKASNARKSRHLYELTRAMKGLAATELGPDHRDGIMRLRGKLVENETVLRAHLDAVSEVAGLIRGAIERAEADGTYSAGAFGYGQS